MKRPSTHLCSLFVSLAACILGCAPAADHALDIPADEAWTFLSIEGMQCADGSPGGVFANRTTRSDELVIFFRGGGICFDPGTCLIDTPLLEGLGEDPLAAFQAEGAGQTGIFDRDDATNPFRDATFVLFPHCTGDFHLGNVVREDPTLGTLHQVGYVNVEAALKRLVPTFAHASRITVSGFSAGGVGASVNYHQIAAAFARVHQPPPLLVVDGGPLLRPTFLLPAAQQTLRNVWNLDATIAPWCPSCMDGGLHLVYERNRELHPGLRTSLVCAYDDDVVRLLYQVIGSGDFVTDPNLLHQGLTDLSTWTPTLDEPTSGSRQREFFYASSRHGALEVAPLADTPGLAAFLAAQRDDDPAWSSVTP